MRRIQIITEIFSAYLEMIEKCAKEVKTTDVEKRSNQTNGFGYLSSA